MSIVRSQTTFSDPDEAARLVSSVYFPHDLRVLGQDRDFGLRIQSAEIGPVTVGILSYGVEVSVDCSYPRSYTMNIPLSGRIESLHEGRQVRATSGRGTLFSPDQPASVTLWTADCVGMGLKVDRDYMTRKFRQLSGTDEELILPRQLDLSTSHWRGWVNLLHALAAQPTGQDDLLRSEVVAEQLSGAITDSFLAGLISMAPHDRDVSPARPRQVKRVLDAIHGQPARSWTLSDMAEVAEVSGRRLQQSFKETVGLSPIEYLRDLRLALVHQDLLENVENASVHEVAARWGFLHAGRFSLFYKQKYGRLPSQVFRNR